MIRPLLAAFLAGFAPLAAQTPTEPPASRVVEGRVVDGRGDGVPAAELRIAAHDAPDTLLAKSTSDGDGFFRLGRLPAGITLQLTARTKGSCTVQRYVSATTTSLDLRLLDAATVRGVLRNAKGEPVANTIVRAALECRAASGAQSDARTDAEGRFELRDVALGPCRISAWIDGEGLAETPHLVSADCDVALAPSAEPKVDLEVVVSGLPADAGPIRLSLLPYTTERLAYLPPPHDRPQLAADGTWKGTGLPDRRYLVQPTSTKFAFAPREIQVQAEKGPYKLKFAATPLGAGSLACPARVLGPDGKPVAGVPFVMRARNGGLEATATSAEDGTLTFAAPLAAGTEVVVYTTEPKWVTDQEKSEERAWDRRQLRQHETAVDPKNVLALRLIPACSVAGRLLLADGRPAPFVAVELQESSPNRMPLWMTMSRTVSKRDGSFAFTGLHHFGDPVRVAVGAPVGAATGEPLAIAAAGTKVEVGDVKLSSPAIVEGTVRDAQEKPLAGARVWLREWDLERKQQTSGSVVEALTDRQGRYRFVGAQPGGAYLQLLVDPGERGQGTKAIEPFEIEAGKTQAFDLQAPAK